MPSAWIVAHSSITAFCPDSPLFGQDASVNRLERETVRRFWLARQAP